MSGNVVPILLVILGWLIVPPVAAWLLCWD